MTRDHDADGRGVGPRTAAPKRRCARCGCDENHACLDIDLLPCAWAAPSLCTYCDLEIDTFKPGMKVFQAIIIPATETQSEQLSLIVQHSKMARDAAGLFVECDLTNNVTVRPGLITGDPGRAVVVATGILASCFDTNAIVTEMAGLFAQDVITPLLQEREWWINEFQVRQWVAENKVPY